MISPATAHLRISGCGPAWLDGLPVRVADTRTIRSLMNHTPADSKARRLRALGWGKPDGPLDYKDIPDALRPVARAVDALGDDLARLRFYLLAPGASQRNPIVQVQIVSHALAHLAQAVGGPDEHAMWIRPGLAADLSDVEAVNSAIAFMASGGEPNTFRTGVIGRPAMKDIRAVQMVCREIVDLCTGTEGWGGVSPCSTVEDFVRMHAGAGRERGVLADGWEEHPLGLACFEAVRAVRDFPDEPAEFRKKEPQPYTASWLPDDWAPPGGAEASSSD